MLEDEVTSATDREKCLKAMQVASNNFYIAAVRSGNHAFIEFTPYELN